MLALAQRELVRFARQRSRLTGALLTPIVFWLLIGFGVNQAFVLPGTSPATQDPPVGYLDFFFPGALTLILLFTSIFTTISVIEDRREGLLQGVLVSPASRRSIVAGKVLGGAAIATLQGLLFLFLLPLTKLSPNPWELLAVVPVMAVLAVGLTALGLSLAWPMDSTAGFHAVMNLLLMPMWLLSGAIFPLTSAPLALQAVMYVNPLTYGHALLTWLLLPDAATPIDPWIAAGMLIVLTAAAMAGAVAVARRK